uniref:Uncharacterized protein n=1 Tax=Romanomermis culicivorax TaxID=13658 RepID=A0A915IAN9_ROMCU
MNKANFRIENQRIAEKNFSKKKRNKVSTSVFVLLVNFVHLVLQKSNTFQFPASAFGGRGAVSFPLTLQFQSIVNWPKESIRFVIARSVLKFRRKSQKHNA